MKIYGTAKGGALMTNENKMAGVAFSGSAGGASYESGLGDDADWTTVSNLTTNDDVSSPSGLGDKSWLSNGSSTSISLTAAQLIPTSSDFTIVTWIYPTTIKAQNVFTSASNYLAVIYLQQSGERLEYIVKDGSGNNAGAESNFDFEADTWYMIACTFDASAGQAIGYVFDTSDDSKNTVVNNTNSSCNSVATNTNWNMMKGIGGSGETFAGRINSMAVWNEILDSDALDELFATGDGLTFDNVEKTKILCYYDSQTGGATISNLAVP